MMATFLEQNLPPYMDLMRVEWALEFEDLPEPAAYLAREPGAALDRWPLVAVTASRARVRRLEEELHNDATVYDVTYTMRVFFWVREDGLARTLQRRDDLAQAMLQLLLDYQVVDDAQSARVNENTMSVEYSDATSAGGDRFISGAYLAFDLNVEEKLQRTDRVRGTVGAVAVDGFVYGPTHPAFEYGG